jgi:hypothetical protein
MCVIVATALTRQRRADGEIEERIEKICKTCVYTRVECREVRLAMKCRLAATLFTTLMSAMTVALRGYV